MSSPMRITFLGQFLVRKGLVTEEQLLDAVGYQKSTNELIGVLAVKRNFLTPEQVDEILDRQREADLPFGQIALERGLMTQKQLQELLTAQNAGYVFLGEALIAKGHLTSDQFVKATNEYGKLQQAIQRYNNDLVMTTDRNEFLMIIVESLQNAFSRYAHTRCKLGAVCQDPRAVGVDIARTTTIRLTDGLVINYSLAMSRQTVNAYVGFDLCDDCDKTNDAVRNQFCDELTQIVANYVKTKIEVMGFVVHDIASCGEDLVESAWTLSRFLLLTLETLDGPLLLGYRIDEQEFSQQNHTACAEDWEPIHD